MPNIPYTILSVRVTFKIKVKIKVVISDKMSM